VTARSLGLAARVLGFVGVKIEIRRVDAFLTIAERDEVIARAQRAAVARNARRKVGTR
jgi:hypothetical protein